MAAFAAVLLGCSSPFGQASNGNDSGGGIGEVEPPPGTVAVTFTIDDTANQVYLESDGLAWKGSFVYDSSSRVLSHDSAWSGPYPMLYDDGTHGDPVADDHVWTVTVFAELPDSGDLTYEHGAIRNSVNGSDGEWIWLGSNGSFAVSAGNTTEIEADGLTLPPFGTIDFKITLDTTNLATPFAGLTPTTVEVKSSAWKWSLKSLHDDGTHGDEVADDDTYTMQFSLDQDRLEGLLELDEEVGFLIELDGVEYKSGDPLTGGVTAFTDWDTPGTFIVETVSVDSGSGSLQIVVGAAD